MYPIPSFQASTSRISHHLCAAVAVVEIVSETHHATGTGFGFTDALAAAGDGVDAFCAARAAERDDGG